MLAWLQSLPQPPHEKPPRDLKAQISVAMAFHDRFHVSFFYSAKRGKEGGLQVSVESAL